MGWADDLSPAPGQPVKAAGGWADDLAKPAQGYQGEPDLPIGYDSSTGLSNFLSAAAHNVAKPFTNMAQWAENAVQAGVNALPDNPVSRAVNRNINQTRADREAAERQYQTDVPNTPYSYAGAAVGTAAPLLAGGGEALSNAGANVASDFARYGPTVQRAVSGLTQGVLAAPAYTSGSSPTSLHDLARNTSIGAGTGAAIPIIGGALGWTRDQVTGVLKPLFAPKAAAAESLEPLATNVAQQQAPFVKFGSPSGQSVVPQITQDPNVQMIPQQAPMGDNLGVLLTPREATESIVGGTNAPWVEPVPGVRPTAAQSTPTPELIAAEKVMRTDANTRPMFDLQDAQNNAARWNYLKQFTDGDNPAVLQQARNVRDTTTAPMRAQVFQNPVDASPILKSLTDLQQGSFGARPGISGAINDLLTSIGQGAEYTQMRFPGAPQGSIAPDLLDAYRQNVRDFLAKNMPNGVVPTQAQAAFGPVKDAITNAIEGSNPGYRAYLARYAELSQPINSMEAANSVRDYFANRALDTGGKPILTLSGFNTALDRAQNLDYGLTPQANQAFENVRQSLQRSTLSNSLRSAGSDTAYNLQAPSWLASKTLGSDLEGGVLSKIPLMKGFVGKPATAINQQRAKILLNPDAFQALGRGDPAALANALRNQ